MDEQKLISKEEALLQLEAVIRIEAAHCSPKTERGAGIQRGLRLAKRIIETMEPAEKEK